MSGFELEPGNTVSHFRLEKKLGEGGMGAVFLAEDLTLSRPVAIKFMNRNLLMEQQRNAAMRENIEQRFIREARTAAAINHPNLAQIYEANFETDNWYIAMELIDGASLQDRLADGKGFSLPEIIGIARQTCSGLSFAYQNYKIIHRDIKPGNIMLTKTEMVKIVDLGLAKPLASEDADYDMPELTNAGVPIGTPQYMAPEQATGRTDMDQRADIFALGATLYEICVGAKAFSGATAPMIYMSQLQKKYKPILEQREDVPQELVDLIDAMLEPELDDRIATYDEIIARLGTLGGASMIGGGMPTAIGVSAMADAATVVAAVQTEEYPVDHLIHDRFRVLKFIGKSQAGFVYHCLDTRSGVECAVKSLWPGREFPLPQMPRIKENYQKLLRLSHPNLVLVRDLIQIDKTGELLIVMQLLGGRNLREHTHRLHIDKGDLVPADVQQLLLDIAFAIDDIGRKLGATHHDLKPESIFITSEGHIKLLDYGMTDCARDKDPHRDDKDIFKYPLASPDYMPPELWQHEEPGARGDQYSFALVVYEMLSKRLPFWLKDPAAAEAQKKLKGMSEQQKQLKVLYDRVLNEAPPPIARLKQPENAALIKALAKQPTDRHESCSAFVQQLTRSGMSAMAKGLLAAAALVVLLAVAGGIYLATRQQDQQHAQAPQHLVSRPVVTTPVAAGAGTATTETDPQAVTTEPGPDELIQTAAVVAVDPVVSEAPSAELLAERAAAARISAAAEEAARIKAQAEAAAKLAAEEAARQQREAEAQQKAAAAAELLRQQEEAARLKAEEAARLEAEEEARKKAELQRMLDEAQKRQEEIRRQAQLAKLKGQADQQLANVEKLTAELAAEKRAAELLPLLTDVVKIAQQAYDGEQYEQAIMAFKQAVDTAHDIGNQVKQMKREECDQLKAKCDEWRERSSKYETIDPALANRAVAVNVSLALARESYAREDFDIALTEFSKVIDACGKIVAEAEAKYIGKPGSNWTVAKAGLELVWLPAMKLWAGKFEVTNAQYRKFKPGHDSKKAEGFTLNGDSQPVLEVSYYDSVAYCTWLNATLGREGFIPKGYAFRLPTKEEWQTLAACGEQRLYPWGSDWPPPHGNFGNQEVFPEGWQLDGYTDKYPVTCDVAESGENGWGLFGVSGNVWEWVSTMKDGNAGVFGGAWTSTNRKLLYVEPPGGANYAPTDEPFDNIGLRVLLAPAAEPN